MCQLFTLVTLWLTRSQGSHSPAPWENSVWNIASSKKEKNPKLKLGFQLWCITFTSWLSWKILSQTIMSQEPSAWYNQKLKKKYYPSIHPFIHLATLSKYGLKGWCQPLSCVQLFVMPCTLTRQASLLMGFSRQEYWSGLPFPSQGIFLTQGSNTGLLHCIFVKQ